MINQYVIGDSTTKLSSDLAAEFPIYIYLSGDKKVLLYSDSISDILDDSRVVKPLNISNEGLSFLLQSGVIPPPKTIYENIFLLGVGYTALIMTRNEQICLEFNYAFPFLNSNRFNEEEFEPDESFILEILAEATISRIDANRQSFLFHSAGKDSNSIALALADAGWQDKVTLVSHKSKGNTDESGISKLIAKKLGFKHITLDEKLELNTSKDNIRCYFENVPIPVVDTVTLAYPMYTAQLPDLVGSNVIDGGGNDIYMGTPPSKRELQLFHCSNILSPFRYLFQNMITSESMFNILFRTKIERCGFSGFSYPESKKIMHNIVDVRSYFNQMQIERINMYVFDFKTEMLTTMVAAEMHIRKFRNAAYCWNSNAILPFANKSVAEYFYRLPEKYLFDRKSLKNKLILRKILKDRIGLDSDAVGKMGYTFDFGSVLADLGHNVKDEILSCKRFNSKNLEIIIDRLQERMKRTDKLGVRSKQLINRLFLISAWLNHNKYVK